MTINGCPFLVLAAGFISNADELSLQANDGQPVRASDPTSRQIASAFGRWGRELSRHLLGQYAAALIDRQSHALLLLQDSLGLQQAFYGVKDGVAYFASRLTDLVAMLGTISLDTSYLADAIATATLNSERTPYRDVSRLLAGHTWQWSPGRAGSLERPWLPGAVAPLPSTASDQAWGEGLQAALTRAVDRQVPQTGTTWCELSGGLDSTSVAAIARRLGRPIDAITFVSRSGRTGGIDDDLACCAAASFAIPHHRIDIDDCPPFQVVPDRFTAEPGTEIHRAQRDAYTGILHRHDVATLLTGAGGDIVFGSEDCPPLHLADELLSGRLGRFRHELRAWMSDDRAGRTASFWMRTWVIPMVMRHLIGHRSPGVGALHRLVPRWVRRDYLQQHGTSLKQQARARAIGAATGLPPGRAILWEEVFLQAAVIGETDPAERRTTTRHPLLDRSLLEFALMMPHRLRRTAGLDRVLQRQIMTGILPERVRVRRDKGSNQAAFDAGLRESRAWFALLTDAPRLADLGIVDKRLWSNEVRRASAGLVESSPHFFMAATMECWLQRLELGPPPMDFELRVPAAP